MDVGQVSSNTQPVQMMAGELQGAHSVRQVPDLQLVGQGKERTGHLRIRGEAVGLTVRQDVPDGNEQLAGDGHPCFLRSRLPAQASMLDAQLPASRRRGAGLSREEVEPAWRESHVGTASRSSCGMGVRVLLTAVIP